MEFPKRVEQHKAQSDSFAILLYKLKDLGIFRNITESDYGIDFEVEFVYGQEVLGHYFKAQIKSSKKVVVRKDGKPVISGIKQSTLWYWTELSYRTPVLVFAVDLKTEEIFYSRPIFWQATNLIDSSKMSKTIELLPLRKARHALGTNSNDSKFDLYAIHKITSVPNITELLAAHRAALRNLSEYFSVYTDTWHYDFHSEVQALDAFISFLDNAAVLIDRTSLEKSEAFSKLDTNDKELLFDYHHWARKTGWGRGEVQNSIAMLPLKIIFPAFLHTLQSFKEKVINGKYYWKYKDLSYLKLVYETRIPDVRQHEEILRINYDLASLREDTGPIESFWLEIKD